MTKLTAKHLEALTAADDGKTLREGGGLVAKVRAGVRGVTVLFRYEFKQDGVKRGAHRRVHHRVVEQHRQREEGDLHADVDVLRPRRRVLRPEVVEREPHRERRAAEREQREQQQDERAVGRVGDDVVSDHAELLRDTEEREHHLERVERLEARRAVVRLVVGVGEGELSVGELD